MTEQRQMNDQRSSSDQQRRQDMHQDHKNAPGVSGQDDKDKSGSPRSEPSKQFPEAGQHEKLDADRVAQHNKK